MVANGDWSGAEGIYRELISIDQGDGEVCLSVRFRNEMIDSNFSPSPFVGYQQSGCNFIISVKFTSSESYPPFLFLYYY